MKDFHQKNAGDMEKSVLQEAVKQYKETEEGVKHMTETLERYFNQYVAPYEQAAREEGIVQGMEQGQKKEAMKITRWLVAQGFDDKAIAEATSLTMEEIAEIRKEMNK